MGRVNEFPVGSLAVGRHTFEDVREYDVADDDIRAALQFVGELADQPFHLLPSHAFSY